MWKNNMVNEEPKLSPTARYAIGEAAKILGISRNTLRKHTNTGPAGIDCGFRKSNGRKFYTGLDIMRYWRAAL